MMITATIKSVPLTDDMRRAVWRTQYELAEGRRPEGERASAAAISELVERRIQDAGQRANDEAAFSALLAAMPQAAIAALLHERTGGAWKAVPVEPSIAMLAAAPSLGETGR